MTVVNIIIEYIGTFLLCLGAVASLIGSIGMHRFKNFYLRLHATTVVTIWGGVYPIVGASLLAITMGQLGAYRWFMAGAGFVTAFIVLILAPAGSHALARAVHRAGVSRVEPCIHDALNEEMCVKKKRGDSLMFATEILVYLLMALSGVASTIAVYLAMIERDLVKAVIYSAIQSTLYSLLFYLLMAPDIVLVYLPVSVGLIPGVFLLLISRIERREKD